MTPYTIEELEKLDQTREDKRQLVSNATPQKMADEIERLNKNLNELLNTSRDLAGEMKTISTQSEMYDARKTEIKEKLNGIDNRILENNNNIEESKEIREKLNDELNTLLKVEAAMDDEVMMVQATVHPQALDRHQLYWNAYHAMSESLKHAYNGGR